VIQENTRWQQPRFWIVLLGIVIVLIFLYFYQPFETYLKANIPNIHFSNVIFWFASLVGVVAYALSHWQALRQHIVHSSGELQVLALVFDTLQIAILTAVIFTAGAMLQSIVMLSEHLMNRGPIFDQQFGGRLLSIVLLVIMAILFYLLHQAVRAFRTGWNPRRQPPRTSRVSN
jgi:ABC-type xylose transport system permease subunit